MFERESYAVKQRVDWESTCEVKDACHDWYGEPWWKSIGLVCDSLDALYASDIAVEQLVLSRSEKPDFFLCFELKKHSSLEPDSFILFSPESLL